jgi:AraC-like DNA-binding protein
MTGKLNSHLLHENVAFEGSSPIKTKWMKTDRFTFPWHFHSEFEILFIIEGQGIRHVGDHTAPFGPGDMVLMGSHLPHLWQNNQNATIEGTTTSLNYFVIHFSNTFMADALNTYPEMHHIKDFLAKSNQGIHFSAPHSLHFAKAFAELHASTGFRRLMRFMEILDQLAQSKHYDVLWPQSQTGESVPHSDERLNKLLAYLNRNYQQKTSLEATAKWFGMNHTAFARFFKKATGKTFINYVNDLRIAFACKLLQKGNLTVTQVCFESGFNNISNFNRHFKRLKKQTPSEYALGFAK